MIIIIIINYKYYRLLTGRFMEYKFLYLFIFSKNAWHYNVGNLPI